MKGTQNVEKNTEEHPASLVGEHDRGEAMVSSGNGHIPSGRVMSTIVHHLTMCGLCFERNNVDLVERITVTE